MSTQPASASSDARPLLDVLDHLEGGGPTTWQPRRLILHNFWRFDDQTFHFAHGRLVLTGANGSGKSTALTTAVTLVLDNNFRRDRLTPGKDNDRDITYYVRGHPKEHFHYPDGRTSYIAMEWYHPVRGEYLTTGIGMHAHGYDGAAVKSWGFVVDDGRRIGHDFDLYSERDGEWTTRTKMHLARVLGDGGTIVEKSRAYQELVNDRLFGFPTLGGYHDLLTLQHMLRTPSIGAAVTVEDVCEMLGTSLPALPERYIRELGGILDDIDTAAERKEHIGHQKEALEAVEQHQSRVKTVAAQRHAAAYRHADDRRQETATALEESRQTLATRRAELEAAEAEMEEATAESHRLAASLDALKARDEFQQHDRLERIRQDRARVAERVKRTTRRVERARADLGQVERRIESLESQWEGGRQDAVATLDTLAGTADALGWATAAQRFRRAGSTVADLAIDGDGGDRVPDRVAGGVLATEASTHRQNLRAVRDKQGEVARTRERYEQAQQTVQREQEARDDASRALEGARAAAQQARQDLTGQWEQWRGDVVELTLDEVTDGIVRSVIDAADTAAGVHQIPGHLQEVADTARTDLHRERSAREARRDRIALERGEAEEELEELRERPFIEPERDPWRNDARERLAGADLPAVPLYEATDFREDVTADQQAWIERALIASGLLDALIVPADRYDEARQVLDGEPVADHFLRPGAAVEPGEGTLARWLEPAACAVPAEAIEQALRGVSLEGVGETTYRMGSHWRAGPVEGVLPASLTRDYEPAFVGHGARVRRREAAIAELETRVAALEAGEEAERQAIAALDGRLEVLDAEMEALRSLPALDELDAALGELALKEGAYRAADERVAIAEQEAAAIMRDLRTHRRALRVLWGECGVGGPDGQKGVDDLLEAVNALVADAKDARQSLRALLSMRDEHAEARAAADRREEDVEAAGDDLDAARQEVERLTGEIEGLEEKLATSDVEELLDTIRRKEARQQELAETIPSLSERCGRLRQGIETEQARTARLKERAAARRRKLDEAERAFERALTAYPTLADHRERFDDDEVGPRAVAEALLEKRQATGYDELRELIERSYRRADRRLQKALQEHRAALLDFHPDRDEERDVVRLRGPDGQRVLPHDLLAVVIDEYEEQKRLLRERDSRLFREFIMQDMSESAASAIRDARAFVETANARLANLPVVNERRYRLRWTPRTDHPYFGSEVSDFIDVMAKDPDMRSASEVETLKQRVRAVLEDIRQREKAGELDVSFTEAVAEAFDYRQWFRFVILNRTPNDKDWRDLSRTVNSGAEGELSAFIPMIMAVEARYAEARDDAPRLIGMDEAFDKVDAANRDRGFELLDNLDYCFVMTSDVVWGVSDHLAACMTYQFQPVEDGLSMPEPWVWDGERTVPCADPDLMELLEEEGDDTSSADEAA